MKYTTAILALAAAASAQDLSIFPACSLPCITDAVGKATTCATTDFACVCSHIDAVQAAATSCVVEKCGADVALNQVLPATKQFCSQVGSGSSSSSSSAGPASSSTPPAASSSSSSPSSSAEPSKPSTTGNPQPSSSSSHGGSSFATPSPTGSGSGSSIPASPTASSSRPTSSVQTGGAPAVGMVGSLGMLVLGAVAVI